MRKRVLALAGVLWTTACIDPVLSADEENYADGWPSRRPSTLEPGIEYIGRTVPNADGMQLAWPGTMATVRFRGTGLRWEFTENVIEAPANYDVVIDGKVQTTYLRTNAGDQTADIAKGLSAGEHEVSVVRRTEGRFSTTVSRAFVPLGDNAALLAPPTPFPHKVLFVGDSITAGFGILGTTTECDGAPLLENARLAWGSVFARRVGAEAHLVAWSGKGMMQNLDRQDPLLMPEIETRALPLEPAVWDTSRFTPDLVVINLGTNDVGTPQKDPGRSYADTYLNYVRTMRSRYPAAAIAAVLGPLTANENGLLDKMRGYIKDDVVESLRAGGDKRVYFVELNVQTPLNGYGCQFHPSRARAKIMAHTLGRFAEQALGWTWSD